MSHKLEGNRIDDYRILKGSNIPYGLISIIQLTLGDIVDNIGMEKYLYLTSITMLTPKEILEEGSEVYEVFKGKHLFELVQVSEDIRDWLLEFLNTFTDCVWNYNHLLRNIETYSKGKAIYINQANLDGLFDTFKKTYAIQKPKSKFDENMAVDEETAKLVREFRELEESKKSKNNKTTLHSIIESVATRGIGYNLINIWELTMYKLMRTYYRKDIIDNYENTVRGIYAGTVDGSKIKLENIYWGNVDTSNN